MVDGVRGGRSTHGICMGVLSWAVERGRAGDIDLSELAAALAVWYSDDEAGSPWKFYVYVDERGGEQQREALEAILVGRLGGTVHDHFPWVWKPSNHLGTRVARIELDTRSGRESLRVGEYAAARVAAPVEAEATVACVIPGYERPGREYRGELLRVKDDELEFEFRGTCGFAGPFEYSGGS
jgi:hypothetical protein